MFFIDALGRLLEFIQSLLFAGFVPENNEEAEAYNFFLVLLRLFGLVSF